MGCVYSQPRHHSRSSANTSSCDDTRKVFHVYNVDDRGTEINFGKIEITDNELALHQKGKNSIFWPLRYLRRYGFDAELFSFECGRRCPTGAGIYAFKCANAEQLFNTLQEAIQQCTTNQCPFNGNVGSVINGTEMNVLSMNGMNNGASVPQNGVSVSVANVPETGPRYSFRPSVAPHLYSNDIHEYINSPFYVNTPAVIQQSSFTTNNNNSCGQQTCLPNTTRSDVNTNYAKLDDLVRFYVNIKTPAVISSLSGGNASQQITTSQLTNGSLQQSPPHSPTSTSNEPVNYIMLDLDQSGQQSSPQPTIVTTAPATPVSKTPTMEYPSVNTAAAVVSSSTTGSSTPPHPSTPTSVSPSQQYATIDFDKTVALSNSAANHRKV